MEEYPPTAELMPDSPAAPDLPRAHEAEQALLGGLLLTSDNDSLEAVLEILRGRDFYTPAHQQIYDTFEKHMQETGSVDVVSIASILSRNNILEQVGGLAYLQELADSTPTIDSKNLCSYAQMIHDAAMRRQIIKAGEEIRRSCMQPKGQDWQALLGESESRLLHISEENDSQEGPQHVKKVLQDTISEIKELRADSKRFTGLNSGFDWLDKKTSGLQKSDLIVLAGRPSTGKTSLAMNIVENAAIQDVGPVVVFSIEMAGSALMQRMLSSNSDVQLYKIRSGLMSPQDYTNIGLAAQRLNPLNLFIDTSSSLSPIMVRRRIRRIMNQYDQDPALIVIDYLQLMYPSGDKRFENRNLEVAQISREMKALAKEFRCPVLLLSQLNRGSEQAMRRPTIADLRDSGAIEQDADLVMLLYKADDKKTEEEPAKAGEPAAEKPTDFDEDNDKRITLEIAKHRNGPVGRTTMQFRGPFVRFEEIISKEDPSTSAKTTTVI